jgi:hypothetical protein
MAFPLKDLCLFKKHEIMLEYDLHENWVAILVNKENILSIMSRENVICYGFGRHFIARGIGNVAGAIDLAESGERARTKRMIARVISGLDQF